MNAQAINKTPAISEVSSTDFNKKVSETVNGIGSGDKTLVSLLTVSALRWFGVDKGSCNVIENFLTALSDYPVKQASAIKIYSKILKPVTITTEEIQKEGAEPETKITVVNNKKLSALTEAERKENETLINAFAEVGFTSLEKAAKGEPKDKGEKYFKALEPKKAADKISNVGADLIARLILSGVSVEDAKKKLISSIDALTSSEIEEAKKAVLSKTKLKPQEETPEDKAVKEAATNKAA
ncbi:hypothetical protein K4M64_004543 [Salmonella enterica]|nr:hypothetical protein [Salmonella enterica]